VNQEKMFYVANQMNQFGKQKIPFAFLFDFECEKPVLYRLEDIDKENIHFNFHSEKLQDSIVLDFQADMLDFEIYKNAFYLVMYHLKRGDTYLLNLTFPVRLNLHDTLATIYKYVGAKYKILYKDEFLVFSPETFVMTNGNDIFSYPMKGTIDADLPNAKALLLENPKEIAEHYTIVDLIRNDLHIICSDVEVTKFRYFDTIQSKQRTLLQTSSEIKGRLPENWQSDIGTILTSLLPAGSVSGAPKQKTCEIISEAEKQKRGYYTGIAGIFDGANLDSCVMIRYIEKQNNEYFFRAGGGITTQSNCEEEFKELSDKIYVPLI
jgi:para-aminobenzoate synthetase component 1